MLSKFLSDTDLDTGSRFIKKRPLDHFEELKIRSVRKEVDSRKINYLN